MTSNDSSVGDDSVESLEFAELDIDSDVSNSEDFENPLEDSTCGIVPYRFEPYRSDSS